jgi:hypothetical protein
VLNLIVGIGGALLAGLLLTPLFGIGTINQRDFSLQPARAAHLVARRRHPVGDCEPHPTWHRALTHRLAKIKGSHHARYGMQAATALCPCQFRPS